MQHEDLSRIDAHGMPLDAALDRAGIALWSWEPETDRFTASAQFHALLGTEDVTPAAGFSDCLRQCVPADRVTGILAFLRHERQGGEGRLRFPVLRDGGERWLEARILSADSSLIRGLLIDVGDPDGDRRLAQRLTLMKEAMLEVSHSITGLKDSRSLLQILLDKAMALIPASEAGSVLIIDSEGYLRLLAQVGYREDGADSFRLKIEETFTYRVSGGRFEEPFIVNHIPQLVQEGCLKPLTTLSGDMIASNLSTPIQVAGEPVALIIIDSLSDGAFTQEDLQLMGYLKRQAEMALTNLKLYQETLHLSRFDPLTGAFNRGYFDRVVEELILMTADDPIPFAFVIMDLDGLKAVNDRLGHREGDVSLKTFADRMRSLLAPEDMLGRYGGDEFVAVFFELTEKQVTARMEPLVRALAAEPEPVCSFSYGVAAYPSEGASLDELVREADRRLYENKRTKKFNRRKDDRGDQNQ